MENVQEALARVLAEGAGFEPALGVSLNTLSRRAPSTARPPLRRAYFTEQGSLPGGRTEHEAGRGGQGYPFATRRFQRYHPEEAQPRHLPGR